MLFFIYILALPEMKTDVQEINGIQGKTVKLDCKITSRSNIQSVEWRKGSDPCEDGDTYTIEVTDTNSTLTIKDIDVADAGEYFCKAYTVMSEAESPQITVVVHSEFILFVFIINTYQDIKTYIPRAFKLC